MNRVTTSHRKAFTLIELLAVIAIIGVLMGILIPTISGVINTTKKGALKLEVDTLARAVEEYRNKYGEYPPDGSDWDVFQRHIRKAFPQISATELAILDPTYNSNSVTSVTDYPVDHIQRTGALYDFVVDGSTYRVGFRSYMDSLATFKVMDPSEALVFFLGGFSSDPKRPFTGRGGPFAELTQADGTSFSPAKKYQYNVSRENVLFEFDAGRLTIAQGLVEGSVATVSTDDATYFADATTGNVDCLPTGFQADLLPAYVSKYVDKSENSPYVYFDSRTYVANRGGTPYFNFYQRSPRAFRFSEGDTQQYGAIYPMYSDVVNSNKKGLPGLPWAAAEPFTFYQFMEPTKFQIIGPGLDGKYGGRLVGEVRSNTATQKASLADTMFRYPSGNSISASANGTNSNQPFRVSPSESLPLANVDPRFIVRGVDNVANFSGPTMDTAP